MGNTEARGLGDRGLEAVSELGRWRWRSRIGWTRGTAVGTGAGAGTGAAGGAEAGVGAGATLGTAGAATTTTTGEGTVTEVVTGKAEGEGTIGSRASTNWPSCTVTSRWVANFEATLKMERGGVGVPYSLRSSFALPVRGLRQTDACLVSNLELPAPSSLFPSLARASGDAGDRAYGEAGHLLGGAGQERSSVGPLPAEEPAVHELCHGR